MRSIHNTTKGIEISLSPITSLWWDLTWLNFLGSPTEHKLGEWAGNTSRGISNKQFCNPYMNIIDHCVCMLIVIEKNRLKKAIIVLFCRFQEGLDYSPNGKIIVDKRIKRWEYQPCMTAMVAWLYQEARCTVKAHKGFS